MDVFVASTGRSWPLARSGLPGWPPNMHKLNDEEWQEFLDAFFECAWEKIRRVKLAGRASVESPVLSPSTRAPSDEPDPERVAATAPFSGLDRSP